MLTPAAPGTGRPFRYATAASTCGSLYDKPAGFVDNLRSFVSDDKVRLRQHATYHVAGMPAIIMVLFIQYSEKLKPILTERYPLPNPGRSHSRTDGGRWPPHTRACYLLPGRRGLCVIAF